LSLNQAVGVGRPKLKPLERSKILNEGGSLQREEASLWYNSVWRKNMTEKETLQAKLQQVTQEMREIVDKVKEVREKIQELTDFETKLRERFIFLEGRKSMLEEMLSQQERGENNE